MTRGGYDPANFIEFTDRSLETKGKTGGFWSDFSAPPLSAPSGFARSSRIRRPCPQAALLPMPLTHGHFAKWQQDVIASKRVVAKEELPGLVRKIALQPPLRGDLQHLNSALTESICWPRTKAASLFSRGNPWPTFSALTPTMRMRPSSRPTPLPWCFTTRNSGWRSGISLRSSGQRSMRLTVPDCFQSSLSPSRRIYGLHRRLRVLRVRSATDRGQQQQNRLYQEELLHGHMV